MFFLATTLVGWIGGDFVYRKVAAKNSVLLLRGEKRQNHPPQVELGGLNTAARASRNASD